jgi:hypothetical protein
VDATDFRRRDDRDVGTLLIEKSVHRRLIREIHLATRPRNDRDVSLTRETPHECGTDHALMSSNVKFHTMKRTQITDEPKNKPPELIERSPSLS